MIDHVIYNELIILDYPSRFASSIILFGFSHNTRFLSGLLSVSCILSYTLSCVIRADNLYIFDFILYINWCTMDINWGNCYHMITTYGVKNNKYSGFIGSQVMLDDMFNK